MTPPQTAELPQAVLRRLREADGDAMAAAVKRNLEHLSPWMPWATPAATDADFQRRRGAQVEQAWDGGSDFVYALWADDLLIGTVGLHRRIGPGGIEIGYWLDAAHTGRGIMTTAVGFLTPLALGLADVERVEIHTDEANVASAAIPPRAGYTLERVDERDPEAPGESGRLHIWVIRRG